MRAIKWRYLRELPDFTFEENARNDGELKFNIVEMPAGLDYFMPHGSIRVLGKRTACRWIMEETQVDDDDELNGFIPKESLKNH